MKSFYPLFLLPGLLCAEDRALTLKQAVERALRQNPEVMIARLDEQKAQLGVRIARDPFLPKVFAGSGDAYTYGYPNSIDGAAPSIIQIRTDMALFNRSKSFGLAEARENARGAGIQAESKTDEIVYRTAVVFLDAEQAAHSLELVQREAESLERVRGVIAARVSEGRQLELDRRRADVDLARARQRAKSFAEAKDYAEGSLSTVLGYGTGDRVTPVSDDDGLSAALEKAAPANEDAAAEAALGASKDLKSLASQLAAKILEVRSERATRLPQVGLIAQYALFAKSSYQAYFGKFQRNNAQLGVDVTFPLLLGSAPSAQAAQAETDTFRIRQQVGMERNRVSLEARHAYQEMATLTDARSLAKLDLEVQRDQLSLLLAQLDEGRASSQQVDAARVEEQEKWIAYYAADNQLQHARLSLLHQTGALLAALR